MTQTFLLIADGIGDYLTWWQGVLILVLIGIIVGYKIYQKKMME